jgi:tyrosyl-tRNA synthetase
MIGDPTGQSKTRPALSESEVARNAKTYQEQAFKILDKDPKKIEIVKNNDWLGKLSLKTFLETLGTQYTVDQLLQREDFDKRRRENKPITVRELMYPLLQGYDSVKLEADVELGGTDQIFNLLVGRQMQKDFGQSEQIVITMPLLEGTDGVKKMSKSYGNYIGINDSPTEMFGKIMSISDELMFKYYTLLTDEDLDIVKNLHPKEAKLRLAENIVCFYYLPENAKNARLEFERVFSQKKLPDDILEYKISGEQTIINVLLNSGLVKSGNEARRLLKQGAVFFNDGKVEKESFILNQPGILKAGARRFLKIMV